MNKKRLLLVLSVICLLFLMTGCVKTNPDGSVNLITSETTMAEVKDEGFLTALLVFPLAQAINKLTPSVGVAGAITITTLVLNILILAFTFKSNVSMQRMQTLQPELEKIQRKYEGRTDQASQQKQYQEMQSLYAKYDVHPFGSLLVTFIQLPILIAMYSAVRKSEAVANGTFMGVSLSTTPMEAIKSAEIVLIVIYVLMIGLQFLSISIPRMLAEAKAKKEAEIHHKHYEKSKQQNVMMTYGMLVFIAFIMLNWPTALSLYYCIYSAINILKTLVIDKITNKGE